MLTHDFFTGKWQCNISVPWRSSAVCLLHLTDFPTLQNESPLLIQLVDCRMVSEGRNLKSLQHGRKRADLVLMDGGVLPPHVLELVVSGSADEMHQHWRRAVEVYQKRFTQEDVQCTVQVIDAALKIVGRGRMPGTAHIMLSVQALL